MISLLDSINDSLLSTGDIKVILWHLLVNEFSLPLSPCSAKEATEVIVRGEHDLQTLNPPVSILHPLTVSEHSEQAPYRFAHGRYR